MLLAIDVGNTNSVFAVMEGPEILGEWRIETNHQTTADEYFVWLNQLMTLNGVHGDITRVVISSTVPRVVFNLRVLSDRYYKCRPLVVGKPECKLPHEPRVDKGVKVGPDRIVNTTAGFDRYGGDLIVVDFGTATTFDVADQDGAYIGGVIAPGVNTSMRALHDVTAALPHIDVTEPAKAIGTNTVECMQAGVFWGYVGLVERIVAQIKAEHPRPMKVIATGGLSTLYERGTDIFETVDLSLTLHGLYLIDQENQD
ncbi:MAG: type III pantothenate kinase [Pseudomonadota bacterium]